MVMAGKTRVIAWGITGITVVAIVIIGAVTLLRGGLLAPGGGAAPPLSLSVLPAGLNSASPAASSSACTLSAASEVSQGNLAVNQSSISVSIDIYPGTTVTGRGNRGRSRAALSGEFHLGGGNRRPPD